MRVSTSWNGNTAYPRNPRQRITVHVHANRYTEVYVNGDVRIDIRA